MLARNGFYHLKSIAMTMAKAAATDAQERMIKW